MTRRRNASPSVVGGGIRNVPPPVRDAGCWRVGAFDRVASPPRKMTEMIMRSTKNRGFSLLELLVVVSIGMTLAGVAFMQMKPLFNQSHVDQAYDTTLS